jgi:hypothetical protein
VQAEDDEEDWDDGDDDDDEDDDDDVGGFDSRLNNDTSLTFVKNFQPTTVSLEQRYFLLPSSPSSLLLFHSFPLALSFSLLVGNVSIF